jgi:gamma-glutamylcyclotransferase (GGCT)/AIG2-like uncharacterized protein YtfP
MRIAVYGSLRKGGKLNHIMQDGQAQLLGESSFPGQLYSLGPYPAAVAGEGEVFCEVWECSDALVRRLDGVEGHPWMYERQKIWLPKFGDCQVYIYQRHVRGCRRIESGRYDVKDWK